MNPNANSIEINNLSQYTARAPKQVLDAIAGASRQTGVDFSYLVQQAAAESNFNTDIKAKTSSATGLYQFIDSTWLTMVDRYGDQYGLQTDGKTRSEILNMRKDPKAASFMAAAFASENEKTLNNNWGGKVGATELYFAHFLGAGGASAFLKARDENPLQTAADLFPKAARANRNVFYDQKTGEARTLEQVYQFFDKKFKAKGQAPNTEIAQRALQSKPHQKKAYGSVSRQLSDNIIMQRSQALREAQKNNQFGQIFGSQFLATEKINPSVLTPLSASQTNTDTTRNPFLSLLSQPVDIMMLTQTIPNKVIRDKNGSLV